MTEINYGNRDIKNQYLKDLYKKYTDHIINFEKHAERMYDDWVIDITNRNYILQKLDHMIRSMIKIYNANLMKIYKENSNSLESDALSDGVRENYGPFYKNIYDGLNIMDSLENVNNNKSNPFYEIKKELLALSKQNGSFGIDDFFRLYINDQYAYLFEKTDIEIIELYNKVFIPINITIEKIGQKRMPINKFMVQKMESKCDSLIGNTCTITIIVNNLSAKIIFDGYISADILNIYLRTSQIYSKHLFNIRTDARNIIKKSYPHIDATFFTKYTKFTNSSSYFIYNSKELVEKIVCDYNIFVDLVSKNFNLVMKEFVHNDVSGMFNIINLLLMGNEQNICTAVLLFNLLKDKKVSGEILSDIIYHNLSYYSQLKLKKFK